MLIVEGLRVTPFGASRPAVLDVSFTVPAGQRVLIVGPSGAGKSTLLLALTGIFTEFGTAEVAGTVLVDDTGLLLQNTADAVVGESIFREVAFGAESAGVARASISALVDEALASVGLAGTDADRDPATLSGGELQRACLAGLLTLRPRVLLLDEPTSQLDADSAREVREAVQDYVLQSGATLVVVEHLFEHWLPLVDRVLVMDSTGRLVLDGPPTQVLAGHAQELEALGIWLPGVRASDTATSRTGEGRIVALVGPSGSGKSTWLNARVQTELAGKAPRQRVGWAPQNPYSSVAGDTALRSLLAGTVLDVEQGQLWLRLMGVPDSAGQNPHELSGGEARRLAVATALIGEPMTVFLDEPTVGQDVANWRLVTAQILAAKGRGATIYLATHDPELISLADEVMPFERSTERASASSESRPWPFSPLGVLVAATTALATGLLFKHLTGALVSLVVEALGLLVLAIYYRVLRHPRLLWPMAVGIASVGFSNWWLSEVHDVSAAALVAARVAYFGLPSLLLAASISPAELGDQLGQLLRLPARPVVAAVVGLGRVKRLQQGWNQLVLVRSLRGVTNSNRVKELATLTFMTLLDATRSSQTTALAMETRGFSAKDAEGKPRKRTWAVAARWSVADWLLVGAWLAIGLLGIWLR